MQPLKVENNIDYYKGRQDGIYALISFIVFPFLLLIFSFKNIRSIWAMNALWAYIVFFGYTLVISSQGMDSFAYAESLKGMHENSMSFSELIASFYQTSQGIDIFEPLLTYSVSLFTGSQKILFAVFGLVFGYFYSRSIWMLLEEIDYKLDNFQRILLFCLALIVPFWYINGFRFWTAAIIFFYSIISFFLKKENNNPILFIILTPFVHFSFFLPLVVFVIYRLVGNRIVIYFSLFVITIFINEIDMAGLRDFSATYFPQLLEERVSSYVNEDYALSLVENRQNINWYIGLHSKLIIWFVRISLALIFFSIINSIVANKKLRTYLSFILLYLSFANVVSTLPSGGRFMTVGNLMAISFLLIFYKQFNFTIRKLMILGVPAILFFCIVSLRMGFDYINIFAIFGNPILSLFITNDISLIDLIK